MPWTQDDRHALERALAKGEQRVTFGDKTVIYRSVDELRAALSEVNRQLAQTEGSGVTRQIRVTTDKGL